MPAPGTVFVPDLAPEAVAALAHSIAWLDDHWLDDVARYRRSGAEPPDGESLNMAYYLPYQVVAQLNGRMVADFYVCLTIAGWKLTQAVRYLPACLAEELCLHVIVQDAKDTLEMWKADDPERIPPGDPRFTGQLDDLYDTAFWDTDFLEMYDPSQDGIDTSPVGKEMGFTSLAVADLFKQFSGSKVTAHPNVGGEDPAKWPRAPNDEAQDGRQRGDVH
jgi:hypothetical protein